MNIISFKVYLECFIIIIFIYLELFYFNSIRKVFYYKKYLMHNINTFYDICYGKGEGQC